jgi:hypothetical protein
MSSKGLEGKLGFKRSFLHKKTLQNIKTAGFLYLKNLSLGTLIAYYEKPILYLNADMHKTV